MKREQSYSSQQSHSSFEPLSTPHQSPFDRATLGQVAQHSSSYPAQRQQEYKLRAGDTLWGIAQKKFGDGRRWNELQKPNGSHFTEQEAHKLQIGSSVYIPGQKETNFYVKPYTDGFGDNLHQDSHRGSSDRIPNIQPVSNHPMDGQAARYPKTTIPIIISTAKLAHSDHAIVNHPNTTNKETSHSKKNDRTAEVAKGTVIGSSVGTGKMPRLGQSATPKEPQSSHYSYDEMRHKPDPNKRTTSSQREKLWRGMADDPKAPLTEVQREQIRATGKAPTWHNPVTGKTERMELAHEPKPFREGGTTVTPRWTEDHAARDPHRHLSRYVREAYQNQGDAIRDRFAKEVVRDQWGYTIDPSVKRGEPPTVKPSHIAEEAKQFHLQGAGEGAAKGIAKGVLRGASRAAVPLAAAVDAYDLTKTYQQDGFGSKFRSQAAGVAGGWGGAALGAEGGAAIGTAIFPGVGTVVGGLIGGAGGYLVGSGAASKLEEGIENSAPKVWNGIKSVGSGIADGAKSVWHSINPFD